MPRTLPAAIDAAILLKDTVPGWLVEIQLATVLRYSTVGEVPWNAQTWFAGGVHVEFGQNGIPTIALPNHANAGSSLMLNNVLRDTQCSIYAWYDNEAYEYYRGYLSPAGTSYRYTNFTAEPTRSDRQVAPRRRMVYPTFTHMPVPGTEIRLGDTNLKVGF